MKIQISTDYAVRILQYLHENKESTHTAMVIASAIGITYPFFIKIANLLKKQSLLVSVQGRNGGYALGKSADQISLYEVFLAIEGKLKLNRCTLEDNYECDRGTLGRCRLHGFFRDIQQGIVASMSEVNIADLAHSGEDSAHQCLHCISYPQRPDSPHTPLPDGDMETAYLHGA